jgi:hypothetical protein
MSATPIIKLRTTSVPGRIPSTSDLVLGELGINTHDGTAFLKKSDGQNESIIKLNLTADEVNALTKIAIFQNGTSVGNASTLNFTGTGVSSTISENTATITINNPEYVDVTGTNFYLVSTSSILNTYNEAIIDYFSLSLFRSAKYLIQVTQSNTNNHYFGEILILHNGTEVTLTEYGSLNVGNSPVSFFDADISEGNVRLKFTPSVSNSKIILTRTSFKV